MKATENCLLVVSLPASTLPAAVPRAFKQRDITARSMLRYHMDQIPLWREDHVSVRELADYFARYIYLPRLAGPNVLAQAAENGVASLTWEMDAFALADGYDEPAPQPSPEPAKKARRFHGTVSLDTTRVGRDAGLIAEEVIAHLSGLVGADVRVTLDIAANIPEGAPEHVVRTVNENSRTLKFNSHEFEES